MNDLSCAIADPLPADPATRTRQEASPISLRLRNLACAVEINANNNIKGKIKILMMSPMLI